MKYSFKIFFTFSLMIICHKSFSQKLITETREIQEIKLLIQDLTNKNSKSSLSIDDTLTLPAYFTNYKEYFANRKFIPKDDWTYFDQSKNSDVKLNKNECNELNNKILKDSNRIYLQKEWFAKNKKVFISSDTIANKNYFSKNIFFKPIFFKNYTRCFVAILYVDEMESLFLKKKNNHWVFEEFWVRWIDD